MTRRLALLAVAAISVAGCGQSDGALLTDAPSHGQYDAVVELAAAQDYDTIATACLVRDLPGARAVFMEGVNAEGVYGSDAAGLWTAFRRWCTREGY